MNLKVINLNSPKSDNLFQLRSILTSFCVHLDWLPHMLFVN